MPEVESQDAPLKMKSQPFKSQFPIGEAMKIFDRFYIGVTIFTIVFVVAIFQGSKIKEILFIGIRVVFEPSTTISTPIPTPTSSSSGCSSTDIFCRPENSN